MHYVQNTLTHDISCVSFYWFKFSFYDREFADKDGAFFWTAVMELNFCAVRRNITVKNHIIQFIL